MNIKSGNHLERVVFFSWIIAGCGLVLGSVGLTGLWQQGLLAVGIGLLAPGIMQLVHRLLLKDSIGIIKEEINRSVETIEDKVNQSASVLNFIPLGIESFYKCRRDLGGDFIKDLVSTGTKRIYLFSSLLEGAHDQDFIDGLRNREAAGCDIRILLVDPARDMAKRIEREQGAKRKYIERLELVISYMTAQGISLKILKLHNRTNFFSFVLVDDVMYVTHYLYDWHGNDSPTIKLINCPDGLFKKYLAHFNVYWESAVSRNRHKRETATSSRWLSDYYSKQKKDGDLFKCRIGDIEKKVPFISLDSWSEFREIKFGEDSTETDLIRFEDAVRDANFYIDLDIIQNRFADGIRSLEDARSVFLDRIQIDDKTGHLQFTMKECSYYQVLTNIIKLENETFTAIDGDNQDSLELRSRYIPDAQTAFQLKLKPFGAGCAVVTALKFSDGYYRILVHERSREVATYPGAFAAIPNFGMEPICGNVHQHFYSGTDLIYYNFIREYIEEIFDYEEMILQGRNKKIDPFWFYEAAPEAKKVIAAIQSGAMKLVYSGFGIDCLNGVPILSFLAIVDDEVIVKEISNAITAGSMTSWEGAIHIVDCNKRLDTLGQWLESDNYHPGAAFAIGRALEYLAKMTTLSS